MTVIYDVGGKVDGTSIGSVSGTYVSVSVVYHSVQIAPVMIQTDDDETETTTLEATQLGTAVHGATTVFEPTHSNDVDGKATVNEAGITTGLDQ